MEYFYSPSRQRFFCSADADLPVDAQRLDPGRGVFFYEVQAKGDRARLAGQPVNGFTVTAEAIAAAIAAAGPDLKAIESARRLRRNQLLAASDHLFLADRQVPEEVLQAWRAYREELRNLDMAGDTWPVAPDAPAAGHEGAATL